MSDYGLVLVDVNNPPIPASLCELNYEISGGGTLSSTTISLPRCDSSFAINFDATSSNPFNYASMYQFKLTALDNTGPLCETAPTAFQPPQPDASTAAAPVMKRLDGESISITLDPTLTTGKCKVYLKSYDSVALSPAPSQTGPCTSQFRFRSDQRVVALQRARPIAVAWEYYMDGLQLSYQSAEIQMGNIGALSCSQSLALVGNQNEVSYIGITAPGPESGTCTLVLQSCSTATVPSPHAVFGFTACFQHARIDWPRMAAVMPFLLPGDICTFSWRYEYALESCNSPTSIAVPIRERCGLAADASQHPATDSIRIVPVLEFTTAASGVLDCIVRLSSCGSQPIDPPLETTLTDCAGAAVFSSAADSALIVDGASCMFELIRVPAGTGSSNSRYACKTEPMTFTVGPPVAWPADAKVTLTLDKWNCVNVNWTAFPDALRPLCYQVNKKDGAAGDWYSVQDCGSGESALNYSRNLRVCQSFASGVDYQFQVRARTSNRGWSDYIDSPSFRIDQFAPDTGATISDPDFSAEVEVTSFSFPDVFLTSSAPFAVSRLYVAKLVQRCKPDLTSFRTLTKPLENGDLGFVSSTAGGVVPVAPAFTNTLIKTGDDQYRMAMSAYSSSRVPAGFYSLVIYGLMPGGLVGQYYSGPFFRSTELVEEKIDEVVDFAGRMEYSGDESRDWTADWPFVPVRIWDQIAVRWTGFLEPKFSELTTIKVETKNFFKLWIDDVLRLDYSESPCVTSACILGNFQMRTSPWKSRIPLGPGVEDSVKQFHSIRIDFWISNGFNQTPGKPGSIRLKWSSPSLPEEVIPHSNLFAAKLLDGGSFPLIKVTNGPIDFTRTVFHGPAEPITVGRVAFFTIQALDSMDQPVLDNCYSSFTTTFTLVTDTSVTFSAGANPEGGADCGGLFTVQASFIQAGTYMVGVEETLGGDVVTRASGVTIAVSAGTAATITDSLSFNPSTPIAGTDTKILFSLADSNGNVLDGSQFSLSEMPAVSAVVDWLFDAESIARLGETYVDERTVATTFLKSSIGWDTESGKFFAIVVILRSGRVRATVSLTGIAGTKTIAELDVIGNVADLSGAQSVVVPANRPFPGPLVAGSTLSFTVQLRDSHGNVLLTNPAETLAVGNHAVVMTVTDTNRANRVMAVTTCEPSLTTGGVFTCTNSQITTASTTLLLSVQVKGEEAMLIQDHSLSPPPIPPVLRSPFPFQCVHGELDPSQTTLAGLPFVMRLGVANEVILGLFDAFGNEISGPEVEFFRDVIVRFFASGSEVYRTSQADVFYEGGFVRVRLQPSVISPDSLSDPLHNGFEVDLVVSGAIVDPFGSRPLVRVIRGPPDAHAIACTTIRAYSQAGSDISFSCQNGGLEGTTDPAAIEYLWWTISGPSEEATYAVEFVNNQYTVTAAPSEAGSYDFSAVLWQRGGLEARFYVDAEFASMLVPVGQDSTYTRLDAMLEFDFGAEMLVDRVAAQSAEWTGYIDVPATQMYRFFVVASGGVTLEVGSTLAVDQPTAMSINEQIDLYLTAGEPQVFKLRFVPRRGANLSVKWIYVDFSWDAISIPPRAFLRERLIPSASTTLTVSPSLVISDRSAVSVSSVAVLNTVSSLFVDAKDKFGNWIRDQSACIHAAVAFPGCLFDVHTEPADALAAAPVISYVGNGQYRADFTVVSYTQVMLHVNLVVDGGVSKPLPYSPFTVTVT